MARREESKAARLVRVLEATVLVIATLYFGRPVLVPVVAAILLTFLLSPPVKWLERRRIPRVAAVLAVVTLVFALLGAIAWNATTQLSQFVLDLPNYQQNLHVKLQDLRGSDSGTLRKLGDSIGQISSEIKESIDETDPTNKKSSDSTKQRLTPVKVVEDPPTPLETAYSTISTLMGPLASVGLLTVLVIFMLLVREDLRDRLVRLAGTNHVTLTTRTFDELGTRISRYLC